MDGQDLIAVSGAVEDAVARARSGAGPTLLEMKTYRFTGHSRGDPAKYRPAGELERWKERDPIDVYERRLLDAGTPRATLDEARERAAARVRADVARAQDSPSPGRADMLTHVLATGA